MRWKQPTTRIAGAAMALCATACLHFLAATSSAADEAQPQGTQNAATLKGLTAVRVVVEVNQAAGEQQALRKTDLQDRLAAKLKKAGLQLLGEKERAQGMPTLYLDASLLAVDKGDDGLFVYSIDLALLQEVRLLRDPGIKTASPTWRAAGALGTVDAAEIAGLRDTTDELVEQFLKAYRAANGK